MPTVNRGSESRSSLVRALALAGLALLASLALAASALGREAWVANYEGQGVSVIDVATNTVSATIPTGPAAGPYNLAITPDGKTAYVLNYDGASLQPIDVATKALLGPPIQVGEAPIGIAITPDGKRAVVASTQEKDIFFVDLQARQLIGSPLEVGSSPQGVAITPDGSRAYVANNDGESVAVVDLATNQLLGLPIPVGDGPYGLAVTPDGKYVVVASADDKVVTTISTATNQVVGVPVPADDPQTVAISPDGTRAFVTNYEGSSITVLGVPALNLLGSIPIAATEYIALTPDGKRGFASQYYGPSVAAFDPFAMQPFGAPVEVGKGAGQVAVVPDQSPSAAYTAPARVRPGVPATLNAAGSSDSDGTVAGFAWNFGDGKTASATAPKQKHTFAKPGKFKVALTVTDNEGCSAPLVFTGQTAYCSGSPGATVTKTVKVAYPTTKLKCPASAKPGGCKFSLQAVAWKGKGKKRTLKPQSAVAVAKVKAGKSKDLALKPRKAFAKKLAGAKKILVREKRTIAGETRTRVTKLKIVG